MLIRWTLMAPGGKGWVMMLRIGSGLLNVGAGSWVHHGCCEGPCVNDGWTMIIGGC